MPRRTVRVRLGAPMAGDEARSLAVSELARLVAEADHLLLDFDGPTCRLFAGLPAPVVARQLLDRLPAEIRAAVRSPDPHAVLRGVHARDAGLAMRLEVVLADAEVEAAATAVPTPGAHDLVARWRRLGRGVSVVTNNSPRAVIRYADLHGVDLDAVAGRTADTIDRMKPHPHLVGQALAAVGAAASSALLFGDSDSDIIAATAAGVSALGYARTAVKRAALAGAAVIVTTLDEVLGVLPL